MILGMSTATYTFLHVLISLVVAQIVVMLIFNGLTILAVKKFRLQPA